MPELGFEKGEGQVKIEATEGFKRKYTQAQGRRLKQKGMFLPWNCEGYRVDFRERNNE